MIAIVNITPQEDFEEDPFGTHLYEVRINRIPKAQFTHTRGEGLAACLRKAAESVERENDRSILQFLDSTQPTEQ